MAASGFTPIKIYASSTAAAVPSAGNLDNTNGAELAINIADGKLFYKDSGGTVQTIAYKNVPLSTVTGTLAVANGGTGQTTASASFNALSPITTTGDLIIGNGVNSATRLAIGTNGYVLTSNGTTATWSPASSGSGDVVGPASATDNAIVRFDTTTGKLIQNSAALVDDNGNISGNNVNAAYTTTATAGGTTTLTATSTGIQYFTGTSNQTVQMPVTSTLALGWSYHIANTSTGILTINSSGGNQIGTIPAGVTAMVTCILTTGTTAASWDMGLTDFPTATGTGSVVLATSPTLTTPTLSGTTTGSDGLLTRVFLQDTAWDYFDSNTTSALDYVNGSVQRWAPSGTVTLSVSNWPPSGNLGELLIEGINLGAATITWPTVNWITSNGTTTTTFSANGVTLQSSGTDWFLLWTRDAGTTVYGKFIR